MYGLIPVYALAQKNGKGAVELTILRTVSEDFAGLIVPGEVKRNLNQLKFGAIEHGTVIVANIIKKSKYEKIGSFKMVDGNGIFIQVKTSSRFTGATLKGLDEVYKGFAACAGLASEASSISGKAVVVALPVDSMERAAKLVELMPSGVATITDKLRSATPAPDVASVPTPAPEKEEVGGYYYVDPKANMALSAVVRSLKGFGGVHNKVAIAMLGASGYGKTTLAQQLAAKLGYDCVRINCALISEPEDIAVKRGIKNGETIVELLRFAKAVMRGKVIVILDEINRAYPNVLNGLFALLDNDGTQDFLGVDVVVGEDVVFVATMNQGSEYTGTFTADRALMNRFSASITVGPLPVVEEVKVLRSAYGIASSDASTIVSVANDFRRTLSEYAEVSTRTTLAVAMLVKSGLTVRQAYEFAVVESAGDNKQAIVDFLNTKLGTMNVLGSGMKLLF